MERTQEMAPARAAGGQIRIRQAGSADREALRDFLTGLSVQTRYLRFFAGTMPTSPAMLRVLAGGRQGVDAIVATRSGVIIGHAMAAYAAGPGGTPVADIGVVVADAWQGRGVGSGLVRTLTARARAHGATTMVMDVLAENRKALTMIADQWPDARHDRSAAQVTIRAGLARRPDR
jgi:GNAT superfamily N-acetyltransferase